MLRDQLVVYFQFAVPGVKLVEVVHRVEEKVSDWHLCMACIWLATGTTCIGCIWCMYNGPGRGAYTNNIQKELQKEGYTHVPNHSFSFVTAYADGGRMLPLSKKQCVWSGCTLLLLILMMECRIEWQRQQRMWHQ